MHSFLNPNTLAIHSLCKTLAKGSLAHTSGSKLYAGRVDADSKLYLITLFFLQSVSNGIHRQSVPNVNMQLEISLHLQAKWYSRSSGSGFEPVYNKALLNMVTFKWNVRQSVDYLNI